MAYSAEIVRKAMMRLAQDKEDRESENRQHLDEAYKRVPRIREIDLQLRRTMIQAAQTAFLKGSDGRALLEEAKINNLSLQRERAQLVLENFEEGFLDETPICEKCGGSGYIGSTMCECLAELCRQEQKHSLSIFSGGKDSFNQFSLDYYANFVDPKIGMSYRSIMEKTFDTCKEYANTFSEKSDSLLFSGDTGLGKTFLSTCIARKVTDSGYSVMYVCASHLFSNMERARFNGDLSARAEVEKYSQCDLLILDDLGTEMSGQFVNASLYSLINDRMLMNKPMIVSTNLTTEDIERRYSRQISSRLCGSFRRVAFVGSDIRRIRNRGY